jgi:uncharacterized phage-like protein YoqJ
VKVQKDYIGTLKEDLFFMDKLSCAIAGHNPQRFKFKYNEDAPLCRSIKTAITEQIKMLYKKSVRIFYVGCAVGVDTWAAEIILELKNQSEFTDIELFCAIPFPEHTEKFTVGQKKRYERILSQCTYKEIINRHYSPTAYKRLNYFMVDKSQNLIIVYDQNKSERSRLVQMVNYALKNNLQITFIHPDTAKINEYTP